MVFDFYARGADLKGFPWAYDKHEAPNSHGAPMFNPLHPTVQEAVIGLVREIATR